SAARSAGSAATAAAKSSSSFTAMALRTTQRIPRSKGAVYWGKNLSDPLQLDGEPGPGVGPPRIGRARRHAEGFGTLRQGEAAEVPQLHEFGELGVLAGQPRQGVVQGREVVVLRGDDEETGLALDAPPTA